MRPPKGMGCSPGHSPTAVRSAAAAVRAGIRSPGAKLVDVSATRVFVARLAGCSVFDPAGDKVGKVRDVLVVYRKNESPRVVGLIVEIPGKRRVFVSIGRVTSIGSGQVITTGLINLRRFEQRGGEVRVIAELLGRKVVLRDGSGEATIEDVAIEEVASPANGRSTSSSCADPSGASPFGKGADGVRHVA